MSTSTALGDTDAVDAYEYDQRNRLSRWILDGDPKDYDYDELGNLIAKAGQSQLFDDPLRPHAITERTSNGTTYTYEYDEDGNVESRLSSAGNQHYEYDSANRLVCRGSAEGTCDQSVMRYDVHGSRIVQINGGSAYEVYPTPDFTHDAMRKAPCGTVHRGRDEGTASRSRSFS